MRNAVEIGLIAALTLGVLGGSRELILADYLKSNEALVSSSLLIWFLLKQPTLGLS